MNSSLVTIGPEILTIGSTKLFTLSASDNSLPWDLTGGSAQLLMTAPDGTAYTFNATIQGRGAVYSWTVVGPEGAWVRAWKATDSTGVVEVTVPLTFRVVLSPGTPF